MAKITIRGVCKQYNGKVQALKDVSFECQDGEFFCLLGPSGAGKSTTMKAIAGIEPADAGEILLDDQAVTDMHPWERDLAMAFETYALYPQLTVRENLRFPLQAPIRKAQWTKQAIETRVVEIANMLGIGELLDRYPQQLSGGQRQRVALGRALVRKPRAYLLDEPIAHLDAKLRHRMRGELKRIQMDLGITTLYSTPDQLEALSLAQRLAVLNHGRIEQTGTPQDVFERPANIFVARFVGDPPMNIIDARIEAGEVITPIDGQARVRLSDSLTNLVSCQAGEKGIKLGIRPKDLQVLPESGDQTLLKAQVQQVQVLGETSVLTLQAGATHLRAKLATELAPAPGTNVRLFIEAAKCHFFDSATQRRIGEPQ